MEATTEIFLRVQISGDEENVVEGEALVEGYADRMLIDGFSFGMKAKLQAPGPADAKHPDNCQFEHFTVDKVFDRASTRLAGLLKPEKHSSQSPLLNEVRVTIDQQLVEAGQGFAQGTRKTQNAVMVFHLYNARVVDYKLNVTEEKAGATVKESLTFTFQNADVEYYYRSDKANTDKSDYRDICSTFHTDYNPQSDD